MNSQQPAAEDGGASPATCTSEQTLSREDPARAGSHARPSPPDGEETLIDLQAGYVLRAIDMLTKQGARPPWRLHQNYLTDISMFRRAPLEDEGIEFSHGTPAASGERELVVD